MLPLETSFSHSSPISFFLSIRIREIKTGRLLRYMPCTMDLLNQNVWHGAIQQAGSLEITLFSVVSILQPRSMSSFLRIRPFDVTTVGNVTLLSRKTASNFTSGVVQNVATESVQSSISPAIFPQRLNNLRTT